MSRWKGAVEGLPREFWYLWLATLINRVGTFVVPFLALYLTQARSLSVREVGLVIALYGVGSVAASPIGGALADHLGRRRTIVTGMCLGAASMLALGFAQSLPQVAAATLALGLFGDLYRPAVGAMIADLVPREDRIRAFTLVYWAANLGAAIAPALAGLMAARGFLPLFIGDAATTLACATVVFLRVPESRPALEQGATRHGPLAGMAAPFADVRFRVFAAMTLLSLVIFQQFTVALPLELTAAGVPPSQFGAVMSVNGFLVVLLQPFAARAVTPFPRSVVLAASSLLIGAGFGLTGLTQALPGYLATVALWTLGEIAMTPVNAALVADLSPRALRGQYQGAYHLMWSLSMLLGPAAGTAILDLFGSSFLWGACALLGAGAALGHLVLGRRAYSVVT